MKKNISYNWVIVSLCFLMVGASLGLCSSNNGMYLGAITDALGIRRSLFSLSDSIRYISTVIVNLFFGKLVLRYGSKRLIISGFASLCIFCLLYACSKSLLGFYLGGAFLGIGLSWTSTTMVGSIVNKWCNKNRGSITGAVLASNGVVSTVVAQLITPVIYDEGNPFGYRKTYIVFSIVIAIVAVLFLILYRENPPKINKATPGKKNRALSWEGISLDSAIRKPFFYMAGICIFLTGFVLQAATNVSLVHMKDLNIDVSLIATIQSIYLLCLAVCKFLVGFFYDRFGLRKTMTTCDLAAIIALLLLVLTSNTAKGRVMALAYSIFAAIAIPLETIMLPLFTMDLFGNKSYNQLLGICVSLNTAGYAVGTPVINRAYEIFGSYTPMLIIFCIVMLFVTIVFQFTLTAAHKYRNNQSAAQGINYHYI